MERTYQNPLKRFLSEQWAAALIGNLLLFLILAVSQPAFLQASCFRKQMPCNDTAGRIKANDPNLHTSLPLSPLNDYNRSTAAIPE